MDKARLRLFASFRTPAFQIATLPARNRGKHKLYVIPFFNLLSLRVISTKSDILYPCSTPSPKTIALCYTNFG